MGGSPSSYSRSNLMPFTSRISGHSLLVAFHRSSLEIAPRDARGASLFCLEILLVTRIDVKAGLHLQHDIDAGIAQLAHLVRVPGQESDRRNPQHPQDLGGERVGTRILSVAQLHIRLEG